MTFWKRRNVVSCFIIFYRRFLLSNKIFVPEKTKNKTARGQKRKFKFQMLSDGLGNQNIAKTYMKFFNPSDITQIQNKKLLERYSYQQSTVTFKTSYPD